MTKNDGKRGGEEYEVYREIINWDYQRLQHYFSRGGQDDRTIHTLDLVVEKRLDQRTVKEACLDVREEKCTSGREDGGKARRAARPYSTSQNMRRRKMVNWREWRRELQGEGVRGQLGRKWYRCVHRVEPNTGQHVLLEFYEF